MNFEEILEKYQEDTDHYADQDYVKDKLLKFAEEIHNKAIDLCIKEAKVGIYTKESELFNVKSVITLDNGSYYSVDIERLEKLKL